MRILGNIPHPKFRIVAFSQDHHFYIEIEAGPMKQCFKLPKELAADMEDIQKWLDEEFQKDLYRNFEEMYSSHQASIKRNLK